MNSGWDACSPFCFPHVQTQQVFFTVFTTEIYTQLAEVVYVFTNALTEISTQVSFLTVSKTQNSGPNYPIFPKFSRWCHLPWLNTLTACCEMHETHFPCPASSSLMPKQQHNILISSPRSSFRCQNKLHIYTKQRLKFQLPAPRTFRRRTWQ